jgi:uncharacterized membrane protein
VGITASIEIGRRPEEVFAYVDQLARHGEWQEQIESVRVDTEGPTAVGTRATEVRRVGGRSQTMTYEITEHDPPRTFAFHGVTGPLRPVGRGSIEPVADGARSRVTLDFDFDSHGILGAILKPLATRQARKQIPKDQARLKERLESGAD